MPLTELYARSDYLQHDLAHGLNAFNDIYISHDDGDEPVHRRHARHRPGHPAGHRPAIFTLGLAHRTHLAAHQN